MESYFWIVIVLFRNISADLASPHRYTIQHAQVSFNQAIDDCSPGVLTSLATEQEVTDILQLVSKSMLRLNQNEFTVWVGLRIVKKDCVASRLPLRGFKWMEDGSEESQVIRWTEEPTPTCTAVRCAALKVELNGSTVTRWGLIPVTCKNRYKFICKLSDRMTSVEPATPEPSKPEPRPATQKPESKPPTQGPGPDADMKPKTGPELQGLDPYPEPAPGLDSCQHPLIPGARFLSLDPDNSSRIQVECWSPIQLELHCSGRPAVWRLLDNSPANFTTVCQPCEAGFQKDASGNCVDIDECSSSGGASCRHTCLNTEGSYRCVCSDENEKHHNEDSLACTRRDTVTNDDSGLLSGTLIPVLVAVAALVVLVVVVAVTVKCCLIRRSKKCAMNKAEKMAMKRKDGKDSFETANEKLAT